MEAFWFEANQFSGRIENKQAMEKLKKEYPNYQEATKGNLTMFGLPVFGFGFPFNDTSRKLGEFLGDKNV